MTTRTPIFTKVLTLLFLSGVFQMLTPGVEAGLGRLAPHRVVGSLVKTAARPIVGKRKPSEQDLFVQELRRRAEGISLQGFPYVFGGSSPADGGMDCSGTMQYLLDGLVKGMPRTSYQQYDWLKKNRSMRRTKKIPAKMGGRKGLKPGNLIFWGGTYKSGHKVSHVMIYLGQGSDGRHYMFGARGKKKKGLNGSGVDIFELPAGKQKSLIGYGSLPGKD